MSGLMVGGLLNWRLLYVHAHCTCLWNTVRWAQFKAGGGGGALYVQVQPPSHQPRDRQVGISMHIELFNWEGGSPLHTHTPTHPHPPHPIAAVWLHFMQQIAYIAMLRRWVGGRGSSWFGFRNEFKKIIESSSWCSWAPLNKIIGVINCPWCARH